MSSVSTRVDVAIRGVRLSSAPVNRKGGAGPSDDGHVLLDGQQTALPINPSSPYLVRNGRLFREDGPQAVTDMGSEVLPVRRPRFYDLKTADGVEYDKIAKLHGASVLATTVVQTCIRYGESDRCRFCSIEESLRNGATTAVKTPAQLAEVAEAAVTLDGVTQMVMTTGTSRGPDRGGRYVARCVEAIHERVPELAIQVQVEPPRDRTTIQALKDAGASSIGIHVESLDDDVRARWMPSKSEISQDEYRSAWAEAVRVFGRNQVSTYLIVGMGENPDELIEGTQELIDLGVYPFIVPLRPIKGTLATDVDGVAAPAPALVQHITEQVAAKLRAAGMFSSEQKAGCAACGACSALKSAAA